MMRNFSADGGSFKDPSGQVYRAFRESGDARIIRGLNSTAAATLRNLLAEPFFRELSGGGHIVETGFLDCEDLDARRIMEEDWDVAVEHKPIDFVTWPYEWTFSMLKDAALLQLRLLDASVRNGWMLKDATPFNIQWDGARPVFIDLPSFVPWEDGEYWQGYRQFCSTFLTPLMLTAHLGIPFQPLLRSRLEGIPPEEAVKYFYGLRRFKRGVWSHIWFPARAERRMRRRGSARQPAHSPRRRQPKTMLLALLDSLKRLVTRLSYRPASSDWAQYTKTHSYDEPDFERKKDFVMRHIVARRPSLTWDLGANTGVFSRIAAERSRTVVAVDSDQDAIELLYRDLRTRGPQNIIPLVMDMSNLSPGQGWAGRERAAFDERRSPDMALCLALVHHMRVSANIPLPLFVEWLRSLDAALIVEFVGRDDEMFLQLIANKREGYADYTPQNFEAEVSKRFSIGDRLRLKGGKRELVLLQPV